MAAFISVLYNKLSSAALKTLSPNLEISSEIKNLERSLFQIKDLLTDASQKAITDQSVKRWLNDLQHLAYDIDDVLDDLATEGVDRELTDESETNTSKVQKLLDIKLVKEKINDIINKLEVLIEEKDTLGLIVKGESRLENIDRRLQKSMVDESSIVGRRVEKERLVHELLGDESCDENFSVVPIVGTSGVGKTTLARLLYDDVQVRDHFELKAWVCVSGDFNSFSISKVIFHIVTGEVKEFLDLKLLQVALRDRLKEKRFLLVLDDVGCEILEDWEALVGPFHACVRGSKIIITTREEKLLKVLGLSNLNHLRGLPHDDAMSLVALHAFGVNNFDSHLSLKPHGVAIVQKCDGLPLALKVLGRLLSARKDEEEYWKQVLDSEIWTLPVEGEIVPALRLSYNYLSAHLKQLFAYCSLFPINYVFDKEEVVQLWMAEGLLHVSTSSDSTEECLGHEYFDELLSRSFFQHAPNNRSLFVMHGMISDLAMSVAGESFLRLEKDYMKEALGKYRHISFVREEYVTYKKFEAFRRAKSLRTFMATSVGEVESCHSFYFSNKILVDLFLELPLLRVLYLSYLKISEIPDSIGTLRHLRYLNLSQSRITHLPESVCNLYNLETLILFGCHSLAKLPNNFSKLKNLRHLDVRDTWYLNNMPRGIGDLKSLQTLSKVFIGGEGGFDITNLKDLKNLCGKISIMGLEKVKTAINAREADFSQKRLSELEVVWSDVPDGSRNEMLEKEVLNELKPCNEYLKQLEVISYGGLEFPNWVGDPSFLRLNHVSLRGCKKCTTLPPLEQLPALKELFIGGLDRVKVVGLEFLGPGVAFPSLEVLSFQNMGGWVKWSTNSGVVSFPRLQTLLIKNCPNLVEVSLEALPPLNVLHIDECSSGVLKKLVQVASSVTKLEISFISGLDDVVWRGVIDYLGAVEELMVRYCNEIRYLWESEVVASKVLVRLRKLEVSGCDNLVRLGEKEEEDRHERNMLISLRMLKVSFCNNMERCSCPDSIESLSVACCSSITAISLPTGGQKLKSLEVNSCNKLLERKWGGLKINNRSIMPMLDKVMITGWPNLKSIVELNYLVCLTSLSITTCESLESFPDNELSSLTSLTSLVISNCPNMDPSFPRGIWPPNLCSLEIGKLNKPVSEWGPQNFPTSLVELYLYGDDGVSSCSQFSHLLPSSLTSLHIYEFEKLESFSTGLQHLTSLQHLFFDDCPDLIKLSPPQHLTSLQHISFVNCPNMMDLPEALLPSLLSLQIAECPKLKERCSKRGYYWPLISHIPFIDLYPQL